MIKRILVVEDSVTTRLGLAELLSDPRHSLNLAACLADARRLLLAFTPDLLIVDQVLPDGCGEDLLAEVPGVPTLLLTACAAEEVAALMQRHPQVVVLRKPTSGQRLLLLARHLLGEE